MQDGGAIRFLVDLEPHYTLTAIHQLKTHTAMTVPSLTMKGQKENSGPIPRNLHPVFHKIVGLILPLVTL